MWHSLTPVLSEDQPSWGEMRMLDGFFGSPLISCEGDEDQSKDYSTMLFLITPTPGPEPHLSSPPAEHQLNRWIPARLATPLGTVLPPAGGLCPRLSTSGLQELDNNQEDSVSRLFLGASQNFKRYRYLARFLLAFTSLYSAVILLYTVGWCKWESGPWPL